MWTVFADVTVQVSFSPCVAFICYVLVISAFRVPELQAIFSITDS